MMSPLVWMMMFSQVLKPTPPKEVAVATKEQPAVEEEKGWESGKLIR